MKFKEFHTVYFLGIGGIGMSALARYFKSLGKSVSGYDKTKTTLTEQLVQEGIAVHYDDKGNSILDGLDKQKTLVIYTPAIPKEHQEYLALQKADFNIIKRAKALGIISSEMFTYAVAGTHGKTTTSTLLAYTLSQTIERCNAFVGGISANFNSNTIINPSSNNVVVEADEFDRSFLQLKPNHAIVTSVDADHLDIYGNNNEFLKSFADFISLVSKNGFVLLNEKINFEALNTNQKFDSKIITYGFESKADWQANNLNYQSGAFYFNICNKDKKFEKIELGVPGIHNAENALAVFSLLYMLGFEESLLRHSFKNFKGVQRRFDFKIRRDDLIVIDDYAHHPTEINAFLNSVKMLYPTKKITVAFQPHLFSRTRDFLNDFVSALSKADNLFLLDIYPAREMPIPGITSETLLEKITCENKFLSSKATLVNDLKKIKHEVILIMGAGDIDTCVEPITNAYQ